MTSPISKCPACNMQLWSWEEAFDKFGFSDGDGLVMSDTVADALRLAGYRVELTPWGMHNVVITGISRDGKALIPDTATVGYDDPRSYLPHDIIELLDRTFSEVEVQP